MSLITLPRLGQVSAPSHVRERRSVWSRVVDTTYAYRRVGVIIALAAFLSVGGTMLAAQRQVQISNDQRELTLDESNLAQQLSNTLNDSSLQVAVTARSMGMKQPVTEQQVSSTSTDTPLHLPKFLGWISVIPQTVHVAP